MSMNQRSTALLVPEGYWIGAPPPIRGLVQGGRNVYRIDVRQVVDLRHCQDRRDAGEESVRRPRQLRDISLAIRGQQPLAAERL
jgi:hypothetical protein